MTEVVPYTHPLPDREFSAEWLRDPAEIANRIGGTDFVPQGLRNNPAAITAALLYGDEVGLGRMQSLARIAVINGRPTLAAEAQRALILKAGHDLWVEELSVTRCTVCGRRRGSEAISRVTWTMDDARRANLAGKPPWKMYPRQMLLARASAELARAIFPDAIAGLVATEELEDDPDAAQVGNGVEPTPPPTRRRRRTTVTTSESAPAPSAPSPGGEPVPAPDESAPAEARSASSPVESAEVSEPRVTGAALPPEEQAVIDEALELGATPVEPETDEPTPISDPQRRKIHALFREQNISDRGERLKICGQILDRDVPTSTGLTSDEASRIIDQLQSNVVHHVATEELDQLVHDTEVDTHELWVQVAGYRHKLVDALVAEIDPSGHAAWKTLRDTLKAEEITDLTGYLKTRGEEGTDDSF